MDPVDLINRFTYHPPVNDEIADRFNHIRVEALRLASLLNETCPDSRELSLAITRLEEVVFWANAAIARNQIG